MGKVIAGITISLDGFINSENGSVDGLYDDFAELHEVPSFQEMIRDTGAAVMGRKVYEMADPFAWANDDYEFQTPIFVVTHNPPDKFPPGNGKLGFTFVTEGIGSAIAKAKLAAGAKDVQVIGGASIIQQTLNEGLCDELQVDIMPVILGKGTRLFENIDLQRVKLERTGVEKSTKLRTKISFKLL